MTTNNQAALQAAATVFTESKQYVRPETVTGMAWQFKLWLDRKDAEDEAKRKEPEPVELSHHITCASRRGAWACDCTPVPYRGDAPQDRDHSATCWINTKPGERKLCNCRPPQPLHTLWTALVRPRNSNGNWTLVRIGASNADMATSHLVARYPGHAWTDLTEHPDQPVPDRAVPKPGPRPNTGHPDDDRAG